MNSLISGLLIAHTFTQQSNQNSFAEGNHSEVSSLIKFNATQTTTHNPTHHHHCRHNVLGTFAVDGGGKNALHQFK